MYKITREQFLLRQPSFPEAVATDEYYYKLANRLLAAAIESGYLSDYPEAVVGRAALCVIGYFQDVVADCGVWRTFISECRRLYGRTLPFYEVGEEYVDFELNEEDVRFLLWYSLSMYFEPKRVENPLDSRFEKTAKLLYNILNEVYEEAPVPEGYTRWRELELGVPEEANDVLEMGNWLFMHCYLMTPAFALTLSEIVATVDMTKDENVTELQQRLEQAMSEDPTGPLALYLGEWLHLVIGGSPMPKQEETPAAEPHKFYKLFTEATGGKEIGYFASYEELNRFFIEALGWAQGEEHLPQMKHEHDFILLVNHDKGMLLARNIARCVADPENPLYDKEYAKAHAIDLLTVRGVCPADLLNYIISRNWLPDAVFPGTENHALVADNHDFIARCYLQQYYRGD